MHDDSPAGLAIKDRTLAYWMDESNFAQKPIKKKSRVNERMVIALAFMYLMGGYN